ncbi:hypothetical protein P0W64_17770 [Tsukamurella sp. 8F]|uniref:hypothetical protein n=1 Tax=unclassified Tsukamurella TaxID=2633480 RepID=UPI0023B93F22|nr:MULTISPECIES: hypothetical protein [unclassified Tsukamurella]MDF0532380.1 hypothetical protein [Tsukamurella sp. 8J]MDF0588634.1 hypothetical protein [Tsukamurella sp. 8F]
MISAGRRLDVGVAAVAVLVVAVLLGGWYAVRAAVPLPHTPVGDDDVRVGRVTGASILVAPPQGWYRVPTGDSQSARFQSGSGALLAVDLITGLRDLDTAAPRRMRLLAYSGIDAHLTEQTVGDRGRRSFHGRMCTANAADMRGECAVVGRGTLEVTVLTMGRDGAKLADVGAVVRSLREPR